MLVTGVVATRGSPAMARLAARIAGLAWLLPAEQGWTSAMPTPADDAPYDALAAATSSARRP